MSDLSSSAEAELADNRNGLLSDSQREDVERVVRRAWDGYAKVAFVGGAFGGVLALYFANSLTRSLEWLRPGPVRILLFLLVVGIAGALAYALCRRRAEAAVESTLATPVAERRDVVASVRYATMQDQNTGNDRYHVYLESSSFHYYAYGAVGKTLIQHKGQPLRLYCLEGIRQILNVDPQSVQ